MGGSFIVCVCPYFRLWHCLANPEGNQRGKNPDKKERTMRKLPLGKQQPAEEACEQHSAIHRRLEDCSQPGAPSFRPRLREERSTDRPFAANAKGGEKSK